MGCHAFKINKLNFGIWYYIWNFGLLYWNSLKKKVFKGNKCTVQNKHKRGKNDFEKINVQDLEGL